MPRGAVPRKLLAAHIMYYGVPGMKTVQNFHLKNIFVLMRYNLILQLCEGRNIHTFSFATLMTFLGQVAKPFFVLI